MKIKCSYCGAYMDDTHTNCPHCGAPNEGVVRTTSTQPLTIEELKQWYEDRHLPPPEVTRFFIGQDYREPRAFGIYKDEKGNCVVYKNKANGQRAVRYEGTDEAYAVNELYQRLKQEIIEQKSARAKRQSGADDKPTRSSPQIK
nr:zinc ribbon domain-containing protein [Lachnospiraceae bacterium]